MLRYCLTLFSLFPVSPSIFFFFYFFIVKHIQNFYYMSSVSFFCYVIDINYQWYLIYKCIKSTTIKLYRII